MSKEKWTVKSHSPLIVDMGEVVSVKGFTYKPISEKEAVFNYAFSMSNDGKTWTGLKKGEFSNIKNNPIPQFVRFDNDLKARFFRFETIIGTEGGKPGVSIDQIGILTQ